MAVSVIVKKTLRASSKDLAIIILESVREADEDIPKKLLKTEIIFIRGKAKLPIDSIEFIYEYDVKEEK